jgi:hypothetical protein
MDVSIAIFLRLLVASSHLHPLPDPSMAEDIAVDELVSTQFCCTAQAAIGISLRGAA